jgi:lipopolysaccharide O-acetyltransferase
MSLRGDLRRALGRVEREIEEYRAEPMKRVALRARVMRTARVRQFHSFGPDAIVHRPSWIYGAHKIAIGRGSFTLTGCWLAVERPAWGAEGPVLELGEYVGIRSFCTFSAARSIVLEDYVVAGSCVTVIDSNHTWAAGAPSVLYNPLETAPVRVGRGTWLADHSVVLSGSDIGEQCVIGANSVVTGTIPDYSIAVGAPAKVVGSTR